MSPKSYPQLGQGAFRTIKIAPVTSYHCICSPAIDRSSYYFPLYTIPAPNLLISPLQRNKQNPQLLQRQPCPVCRMFNDHDLSRLLTFQVQI